LGAKRDEDNAPMRVILYKAVYGNFHGCWKMFIHFKLLCFLILISLVKRANCFPVENMYMNRISVQSRNQLFQWNNVILLKLQLRTVLGYNSIFIACKYRNRTNVILCCNILLAAVGHMIIILFVL
jgi:hypothetical protein